MPDGQGILSGPETHPGLSPAEIHPSATPAAIDRRSLSGLYRHLQGSRLKPRRTGRANGTVRQPRVPSQQRAQITRATPLSTDASPTFTPDRPRRRGPAHPGQFAWKLPSDGEKSAVLNSEFRQQPYRFPCSRIGLTKPGRGAKQHKETGCFATLSLSAKAEVHGLCEFRDYPPDRGLRSPP